MNLKIKNANFPTQFSWLKISVIFGIFYGLSVDYDAIKKSEIYH